MRHVHILYNASCSQNTKKNPRVLSIRPSIRAGAEHDVQIFELPSNTLAHTQKTGRILYAYCFSDIASRWLNKGTYYKLFIPRPRQRPSVSGGLFCVRRRATTFLPPFSLHAQNAFCSLKRQLSGGGGRAARTVSLINLRKKLGRFCVAAAAASPHY
jgi:hypothetical protein